MSEPAEVQPTLEGQTVALRPWASADAETVFRICQDSQIQLWTAVPVPYELIHAQSYVDDAAPNAFAEGGGIFAICDIGSGDVVGSIGSDGLANGVAHVGYWVRAEARRRGYAVDALRTITRWLLRSRGAARVELVVEPHNAASVAVAERAGYSFEGVLRSRLMLRERRIDVAVYSMLPGDPTAP